MNRQHFALFNRRSEQVNVCSLVCRSAVRSFISNNLPCVLSQCAIARKDSLWGAVNFRLSQNGTRNLYECEKYLRRGLAINSKLRWNVSSERGAVPPIPLGASRFFKPAAHPRLRAFFLCATASCVGRRLSDHRLPLVITIRQDDGETGRQPAAWASASLQNQRSPRALTTRTLS